MSAEGEIAKRVMAEGNTIDPGNEPHEAIDQAKWLIERFAHVDGEGHKRWLLDQVIRALTGPGYADWHSDWVRASQMNSDFYPSWDEGVLPA